jgi:CYTH domain-containing protein
MIEYERKFLVDAVVWDNIKNLAPFAVVEVKQGYVCADEQTTVRIRHSNGSWYWNVKQATDDPAKRIEHEFIVPDAVSAEELYSTLKHTIEKTRYEMRLGHLKIEIDEFHGRYHGVVIAEVELTSEADSEFFNLCKPSFIGREVTGMKEWSNHAMSMRWV